MPLTNAGAVGFANALIANTFPTNSSGQIGVGDSSTVFAATQTDLQASSNKLRNDFDSGYPTNTSGTLTFRSTFTTGQANFTWNEWGIFDKISAGRMYSRKVENLGPKNNTQTWQITATITVAAA